MKATHERMAALGLGPDVKDSRLFHRLFPLVPFQQFTTIPEASGVAGAVDLSRIPIAVFDIASNLRALSLLRGSGGRVKSFASASVRRSK